MPPPCGVKLRRYMGKGTWLLSSVDAENAEDAFGVLAAIL